MNIGDIVRTADAVAKAWEATQPAGSGLKVVLEVVDDALQIYLGGTAKKTLTVSDAHTLAIPLEQHLWDAFEFLAKNNQGPVPETPPA